LDNFHLFVLGQLLPFIGFFAKKGMPFFVFGGKQVESDFVHGPKWRAHMPPLIKRGHQPAGGGHCLLPSKRCYRRPRRSSAA
jgi:hypothetical protein